MAANIKQLVNQEIAQLRKAVERAESLLASLKADLKAREAIERLLAGTAGSRKDAKPPRVKRAKQKPFDREAVLGELSNTFTTDAAAHANAARGKSQRQVAMAVARWIKAGRIKKLEVGKYRKA